MKPALKPALAAIILVLSLAAPVAAGPFEDATAASGRDDTAALRLLRALAAQGNASAQSILGSMYQLGLGVPQNSAEALKWFRLAADQGHANAQTSLGLMYANGQGVPQDYAEAVKWYRLAADQGHANAQAILGSMYQLGQGAPQDYVLAHMWFDLSAAQDNQNAATRRDSIAKRMTPAQIAEAQKLAREWRPTP